MLRRRRPLHRDQQVVAAQPPDQLRHLPERRRDDREPRAAPVQAFEGASSRDEPAPVGRDDRGGAEQAVGGDRDALRPSGSIPAVPGRCPRGALGPGDDPAPARIRGPNVVIRGSSWSYSEVKTRLPWPMSRYVWVAVTLERPGAHHSRREALDPPRSSGSVPAGSTARVTRIRRLLTCWAPAGAGFHPATSVAAGRAARTNLLPVADRTFVKFTFFKLDPAWRRARLRARPRQGRVPGRLRRLRGGPIAASVFDGRDPRRHRPADALARARSSRTSTPSTSCSARAASRAGRRSRTPTSR